MLLNGFLNKAFFFFFFFPTCQAKYVAYSGHVDLSTGVLEDQNSHQNPKSENGAPENVPDESNNMEEDAELNVLSNGQSEVLPSESCLNKESDNNPQNDAQRTKMEE